MKRKEHAKRLLIVSQHYWPESFRINDVVDYFVEQGHSIDVLCGRPNYPKGAFFDGYGFFRPFKQTRGDISIYRTLEIPRGNNTNLRIFLNYISFPIFSLLLLPLFLFKRYDAIFVYETSPVMMALPGIILSKLRRVPCTIYVLDLWPENLFSVVAPKSKFLRSLLTSHSHWYYKNATKLIALSTDMQKRLASITKRETHTIPVIIQSCEELYSKTLIDPALIERFDTTFNVVFTGSITPAQDPSTMIRAARVLKDRGHDMIRWIIVGEGMARLSMEQHVADAGLNDVFIFEGFQPMERIPAYTHVADILVGCLVKSDLLQATIPAKVISYIAAGRPVVVAMDGEAATLISHDVKCGYAGPTEDHMALAHNIEKIVALSARDRNEMGERARSYHARHLRRNILLQQIADHILD